MIKQETFGLEHIKNIYENNKVDKLLLERSLYALGLLEALLKVKMPFVFKGGTSLMLILDEPKRLSTDIDIIVKPNTDVEDYLNKASKIFPFTKAEQQIRKGKNDIEKRHFKFIYNSPINKKEFYILLDVLYEENKYSNLVKKSIKNKILLTEEPFLEVTMPSVNCLLGDKLTAFAPHTTGISFGIDKELEIIKQMYDIATLIDFCDNFDDVRKTYINIAKTELSYRGLNNSIEDVLEDTINASVCIASRGQYFKEDYQLYLKGIRSITNHIYEKGFSAEKAVFLACKVMYIATCLLRNKEYTKIINYSDFINENIGNSKYSKLSYLRKINLESFAYVVKSLFLL